MRSSLSSSTVLAATLAAAQLASAHFGLVYPPWRVDTLAEANEEIYSQWEYPCTLFSLFSLFCCLVFARKSTAQSVYASRRMISNIVIPCLIIFALMATGYLSTST